MGNCLQQFWLFAVSSHKVCISEVQASISVEHLCLFLVLRFVHLYELQDTICSSSIKCAQYAHLETVFRVKHVFGSTQYSFSNTLYLFKCSLIVLNKDS